MPVTSDDLRPGARFSVKDGTAITPQLVDVEVRWVDRDAGLVHYHKDHTPSNEIRETGIERFLEIVNDQ
jgi:hypothetical protein